MSTWPSAVDYRDAVQHPPCARQRMAVCGHALFNQLVVAVTADGQHGRRARLAQFDRLRGFVWTAQVSNVAGQYDHVRRTGACQDVAQFAAVAVKVGDGEDLHTMQ